MAPMETCADDQRDARHQYAAIAKSAITNAPIQYCRFVGRSTPGVSPSSSNIGIPAYLPCQTPAVVGPQVLTDSMPPSRPCALAYIWLVPMIW